MEIDSLTRAFIRGAALAVALSACGDSGSAAPQRVAPQYEPIPKFPSCVGPDYGYDGDGDGFYGQCCADVRCIQTDAGVCPDAPPYAILPPGSGECECEENLGPFAPRVDTDDCCYVVYEIGCDGRPLRRDGIVVVAEVARRTDWIDASKLPAWS